MVTSRKGSIKVCKISERCCVVLRSHVPCVPPHPFLDRFVRNSPTLRFPDSPQSAHHRVVRGCCGHHLGRGLVDHLEGNPLGERLGNCRKPDGNSDFRSTNHFFLANRLAASRGRVVVGIVGLIAFSRPYTRHDSATKPCEPGDSGLGGPRP
jgi:hypothetical protein